MKVVPLVLGLLSVGLLAGCASSAPATNADAAAAANEMNAANRGVQAQPDTDLRSAPPAGGVKPAGGMGLKPHR